MLEMTNKLHQRLRSFDQGNEAGSMLNSNFSLQDTFSTQPLDCCLPQFEQVNEEGSSASADPKSPNIPRATLVGPPKSKSLPITAIGTKNADLLGLIGGPNKPRLQSSHQSVASDSFGSPPQHVQTFTTDLPTNGTNIIPQFDVITGVQVPIPLESISLSETEKQTTRLEFKTIKSHGPDGFDGSYSTCQTFDPEKDNSHIDSSIWSSSNEHVNANLWQSLTRVPRNYAQIPKAQLLRLRHDGAWNSSRSENANHHPSLPPNVSLRLSAFHTEVGIDPPLTHHPIIEKSPKGEALALDKGFSSSKIPKQGEVITPSQPEHTFFSPHLSSILSNERARSAEEDMASQEELDDISSWSKSPPDLREFQLKSSPVNRITDVTANVATLPGKSPMSLVLVPTSSSADEESMDLAMPHVLSDLIEETDHTTMITFQPHLSPKIEFPTRPMLQVQNTPQSTTQKDGAYHRADLASQATYRSGHSHLNWQPMPSSSNTFIPCTFDNDSDCSPEELSIQHASETFSHYSPRDGLLASVSLPSSDGSAKATSVADEEDEGMRHSQLQGEFAGCLRHSRSIISPDKSHTPLVDSHIISFPFRSNEYTWLSESPSMSLSSDAAHKNSIMSGVGMRKDKMSLLKRRFSEGPEELLSHMKRRRVVSSRTFEFSQEDNGLVDTSEMAKANRRNFLKKISPSIAGKENSGEVYNNYLATFLPPLDTASSQERFSPVLSRLRESLDNRIQSSQYSPYEPLVNDIQLQLSYTEKTAASGTTEDYKRASQNVNQPIPREGETERQLSNIRETSRGNLCEQHSDICGPSVNMLSVGTSIFEYFKFAYTAFKGSLNDFIRACVYIEYLELQVPKSSPHPFLWDDFIRSFCSEYVGYRKKCRVLGKPPITANVFYTKNVLEPKYTKRIITTKTLEDAMFLDTEETKKSRMKFKYTVSTKFQDIPRTPTTSVGPTSNCTHSSHHMLDFARSCQSVEGSSSQVDVQLEQSYFRPSPLDHQDNLLIPILKHNYGPRYSDGLIDVNSHRMPDMSGKRANLDKKQYFETFSQVEAKYLRDAENSHFISVGAKQTREIENGMLRNKSPAVLEISQVSVAPSSVSLPCFPRATLRTTGKVRSGSATVSENDGSPGARTRENTSSRQLPVLPKPSPILGRSATEALSPVALPSKLNTVRHVVSDRVEPLGQRLYARRTTGMPAAYLAGHGMTGQSDENCVPASIPAKCNLRQSTTRAAKLLSYRQFAQSYIPRKKRGLVASTSNSTLE